MCFLLLYMRLLFICCHEDHMRCYLFLFVCMCDLLFLLICLMCR